MATQDVEIERPVPDGRDLAGVVTVVGRLNAGWLSQQGTANRKAGQSHESDGDALHPTFSRCPPSVRALAIRSGIARACRILVWRFKMGSMITNEPRENSAIGMKSATGL